MPTSDTIERATTADGADLALKHKPNPAGRPVIFVHGLATNADVWDLPEVAGEGFAYRSLATMLHDRGYDVWLLNLRGHGAPRMSSHPAPGQDDWCVDHFVLYDVPAAVEAIQQRTRQRPVLIGASMGSMSIAGYLQGARLDASADGERVIADADLAARRQRGLGGCVLTEFPAALRWPRSMYDDQGRLKWQSLFRDAWRGDGSVNAPFEVLARWSWLHALVQAFGGIDVGRWVGKAQREPWYRRLPPQWAEVAERMEVSSVQGMLRIAGTFTGATNHRAEVMLRGRRFVFDHMQAGVLRQLAACVRQGAFISAIGEPRHVYSAHYGLVELPVLVVQGGRDRIANAETTRSAFFNVIPSDDKALLFDEEIAHGEIEAAPVACERLYPKIVEWIAGRA